jgi:hypothetical protein
VHVGKGILLGLANVFVIAIGMAALENEARLMVLVVMFGLVPGVLAGAVLGAATSWVTSLSPALRTLILALPAVGVVFGLAREFGMQDLATVSCIPTLVGVLMLERWTRVVPTPPVPVARVTS